MESPDLLLVCGAALLWVFTILIVLALVMRLIILLFPQKESGPDFAVIAAISAAAHAVYPGARVTHIEEKQ